MNTLNLSDFVSDTITEIAKGIENAKENLKELDVLIVPTTYDGIVRTDTVGYQRSVQNIDFDLSITINQEEKSSEENKTDVSAKIQVVSLFNLSLGGGLASQNYEESVNKNAVINRIQFSIPVSFGTNTTARTTRPKISI